MTISQLINKLEELKNLYGNIDVVCGFEDLDGPFLFGNKDNFDFNKNDFYYTMVRRQRTAPNFTADMTFTENLLREHYVRRSKPSGLVDCQKRSYFGEYNTFFDK